MGENETAAFFPAVSDYLIAWQRLLQREGGEEIWIAFGKNS